MADFDWYSIGTGVAVSLVCLSFPYYYIRKKTKVREGPFRVLITGSSRGLGYALAEQFAKENHTLILAARSKERLEKVADKLRSEYDSTVHTMVCDISEAKDVDELGRFVEKDVGGLDIFINNAAQASSTRNLLWNEDAETIKSIIKSNSIGSLLVTRMAVNLFKNQRSGGHLFLMDGSGSSGKASTRHATYGYTKAGLPQFLKSMQSELKQDIQTENKVHIHLLSPGMVYTNLLIGESKLQKMGKMGVFVFNSLAERPDIVAKWMKNRIIETVETNDSGRYDRYLTTFSAVGKVFWYSLFGQKTISICPMSGKKEILDPQVAKYM